MATYSKTHNTEKALRSHLGKIRKRGGNAKVEGKTINYKFDKGGSVSKNPIFATLWYAVYDKKYQTGKELSWDKMPQQTLHDTTWANAVKKVKEISKRANSEVRLSKTSGYNNQGHYIR
jgi:hypothetical protein